MQRILKLLRYTAAAIWCQIRGKEDGLYDVIFAAVQDLGGVYVKLLQFLSLRADLFPDKAKLRFLTFYDQVPIESLNLMEKLTPYQRTRLKQIDTTPFASGTFGQVYRATLNNGQAVVIKVKRADLKHKLFADFLLIKILSQLFNLLYNVRFVDIPRLIREFEATTYKELDYRQEVANGLFLHEQYKNHDVLKIPYTYPDLSTDNIIVQEYIGGIAVTDLLRMREQGTDIKAWLASEYHTDMHLVMNRFSYDSLWQIFSLEKFYSDPHPGNIKILPNNQYAFIDFGIMEPSPVNKRDYFLVIKHLHAGAQQFDAKALSEQFIAIGAKYLIKCMELYDKVVPEDNFSIREKVMERYSEMVEEWRDQFKQIEATQVENFTQVWLDLFTMGQQFNLRLPKGLFAGLRASALIKSVTQFMDPEFFAMKTVYKMLMENIDEKKLANVDNVNTNNIGVEEAIETVSNWYEDLAEADLGLYQDISKKLAI